MTDETKVLQEWTDPSLGRPKRFRIDGDFSVRMEFEMANGGRRDLEVAMPASVGAEIARLAAALERVRKVVVEKATPTEAADFGHAELYSGWNQCAASVRAALEGK